jgi:threonine/homoserine/homoserine lactone efflux protein
VIPEASTVAAGGGDAVAAVRRFLLGYVVVLALPGPNMLAIGAVAALRGPAAAAPLCLGVACGVGTLATCLGLAVPSVLPEPTLLGDAGRVVAGLLLLHLALRAVRRDGPAGDAQGPRCDVATRFAGFGAGFVTAVSNPITAAFFANQLVGPLGASPEPAPLMLTILGVTAAALAYGLILASLLARPALRRAALAWHRPASVGGAVAPAGLAVLTLLPVVAPAGSPG